MTRPYWFQRCTVHWCPPQRLDLVEHITQGRLQLVQAGNFGPMFYGLADDESASRWFVGQPLMGIEANLDYARDLIGRVHDAGARYVGQLSMSWNYGDHEAGRGLWSVWDRLWTPALLGPERPCADPVEAMQLDEHGEVRHWPIGGRPHRTYAGCMCNPKWLSTLKSMIRLAVEDLGVDGFNVHHNFERLCRCAHCRAWLWPRLVAALSADELVEAFGADTDAETGDLLTVRAGCDEALTGRVALLLERASVERRKAAFDEVFVDYGRSLNPDLLLAQWYHKYNFKARDERSLLPPEDWARDESYLWYSQGSRKGVTYFDQGWLADMGLPARFLHAAAGGRPFLINKYDWNRWRLSIAEAAAHGGAALAVHWAPHGQDDRAAGAEERYRAHVYRYHRFLADHEDLYRQARPHSELALVYPRRGEVAAAGGCTDALKRIGTLLEDAHYLFDMILDEQLATRGGDYDTLILAEVQRLSPAEVAFLRRWVAERGGRLVLAGDNGSLREDGRPAEESPFSDWPTDGDGPFRIGRGAVLSVPDGPWPPDRVAVAEGVEVAVYPRLENDDFGRQLLDHLDSLVENRWLRTGAPWHVRVRAWRTEGGERLSLHWVNYRRDEDLDEEVPIPVDGYDVILRLPAGAVAQRVEWLDPETDQARHLDCEREGDEIRFTVPELTVYGIAVVHLRK